MEDVFVHKPISQEEHENISTRCLVNFTNNRKEDIILSKVDSESRCGNMAKIVDDVIWCYFDSRRDEMKIPRTSSLWTIGELVDFIDNIILSEIEADRPDILSKSWNGKWEFSSGHTEDNGGYGDNSGYDGYLFTE